MSALTDDFDLALQVRQSVLKRIYAAMHTAGNLEHHYVGAFNGKRVELQIASPDITLLTGPFADQRARAVASARVLYHSRDIGDAGDIGTSAVADVVVRAVLELSGGDPAPVGGATALRIDWNETGAGDITVVGAAAAAIQDEVKDALLDFIGTHQASYGLPPLAGTSIPRIGSLAFRFFSPSAGAEPLLVIGMNVGNAIKGDKMGLQQDFVQQDWALALSDSFVLGRLRQQLADQLGQLPPPLGALPVTMSDQVVCLIESPFGGCLQAARQRILLDRLDIALDHGAVVFTGQATQKTDFPLFPDVSASFSVRAQLGISPNQQLSVSIDPAQVQLQQWYAQLFNVLTFGTLEGIVRDGLTSALQSDSHQGRISALFSADLLSGLASLGQTTPLQINPVARAVEVRPEAVIVQGEVVVGGLSAIPVAEFAAIPVADAPTRRVFHAGRSWAPGGRLTELRWTFGDGQSETTAGDQVSLVVEHEYLAGGYIACLTVRDQFGRTASRCLTVRPGIMVVHFVEAGSGRTGSWPWRLCTPLAAPARVEFRVEDGETPLSGVSVALSSSTWQETRTTGPDGSVAFMVNALSFDPPVPGQGSAFDKGWLRVQATKAGYRTETGILWLVNCAAIWDMQLNWQKRLQEWLDRHINIKDLLQKLPSRPGVGPPIARRHVELLTDIDLALDVLTKLTLLAGRPSSSVEDVSGILPIELVLGVDTNRDDRASQVAERMDEMLRFVERNIDRARESILPGLPDDF